MFVTSIFLSDALTMGFVVHFSASTTLFILVLVMLGDLSVPLYTLIGKSTTPVSHSYCLLPKSHVEKNFGLISTSTPSPFFERYVISFAAGCSSVPRYFILIFSACGTILFGSSTTVALPLPLTPLKGGLSSSIEK